MAANLASTIAVSATVALSPVAPSLSWQTAPQATVGQAVESWARTAGFREIEIAPGIANLTIGAVTVKASNACAAVERLIGALRYAESQPRVVTCDNATGHLVVSAQ